jgi:hypothetical protein
LPAALLTSVDPPVALEDLGRGALDAAASRTSSARASIRQPRPAASSATARWCSGFRESTMTVAPRAASPG